MSDFELLKNLQNELIKTLEERREVIGFIPRACSKAKIHRLRLQIQEVMLRIENKCEGLSRISKEKWE
ncbi:MAG: hypothetical protein J6S23_02465 [Clostridia bacterium]|jgi:hypothetical protein|nr:hypothetical protein [Clostridia bacterium]